MEGPAPRALSSIKKYPPHDIDPSNQRLVINYRNHPSIFPSGQLCTVRHPLLPLQYQFLWGFALGEVILLPNHGTPPHVPNGHEMMWRIGKGTPRWGTLGFGRPGLAVRIWQPQSFWRQTLCLSSRFRSVKRSLQVGPIIRFFHSHSSCDLRLSRS